MTNEIHIASDTITVGSTLQHATLRSVQTVTEITDTAVRMTTDEHEFVYPREQLALELSTGRFELISQ
ncbi:hypothetical protein SAMN04487948_10164 [Halogranum amylolyticum]|uniref:Uncharacterized protein n=1 Tax=Halogranum amylolyticum TaxID=660520 RepID=A0A1H8MSW3_9EURY|nr:hypothetical protein [Halogranum amylolyticum]SEO20340.1 hypothetical protein SAMN04487948_10164 [Halogranum amylolyticum]